MKILPVAGELFHADGRTDRQTDGRTDGRTDRQTDRQPGRQAGRHDETNSRLLPFSERAPKLTL